MTAGAALVLSNSAPSEAQQVGALDNGASQNSAQGSMASAIGRFWPVLSARPNRTDAETGLSTICGGMVRNADPDLGYQLPQDELNAATQTLNGEEVQAMQQQVGDVGATQVANISTRMDAIRAGLAAPGLSFAGLTSDDDEQILDGRL